METLKKFHWFWAWNDEKEEAWLREMAQDGWHFKSVGFPSNYVFESGPPIDMVYRLDYFVERKEKENYIQMFQDANWEHLGELSGWQYFRQETKDGEVPEIYNDNASKALKYQRLLMYIVIFLPILLNFNSIADRGEGVFSQVFTFFMFLLMLGYCYATFRLIRRYSQLKKKI